LAGDPITYYAFQPLLEHLEADMIEKIETKMFSRRSAFSLLGLPAALSGRRRIALALQGADRMALLRGACLIDS
jgi:hypothetical protein